MTVVIAIASADGLVLAGDSRTTHQMVGDAPLRVLSDFTHKVFEVGNCGVATYGWAFLGERNIAGHMTGLQARADVAGLETHELAELLSTYFGEAIEEHLAAGRDERPSYDPLGFLVAGYRGGVGEVIEVTVPSGSVEVLFNTAENPGAAWRGQTDVILRLVKGVDYEHLLPLVAQSGKQAELDSLQDELKSLEYMIPFGLMNLQDAVDFAVFAIRTTIDAQRLAHGTAGAPGSWPGVGGPIEILTVTPTGGLAWPQKTTIQGERKAGEAEGT